MKRILAIVLIFALLSLGGSVYAEPFDFKAQSVILIEATTGEILYEKNADVTLPPASVTKIMTILLVMEAIDTGKIKLTDMVSISQHAANMGGSQVYLEPGEQMSVDELLKCVVVASANDAAAALAEYCAGSEENFVTQMNRRAKELGMMGTHFENTNGLDDTTTSHLTSARDIAIMSRELLKHEKIFDYTNIWMDTIRNGTFGLTNTNRLIRFYKGANGLKTGSTSKAGFCISATAKRNGLQLIAVIMASPTRDDRNSTAAKLLDFGFANYTFYEDVPQAEIPNTINIRGSIARQIPITTENSFQKLLSKDQASMVKKIVVLPSEVNAPIQKGSVVGEVQYVLKDEIIGKVSILADKTIERIGFLDLLKISLKKLSIF